jgi:hypothetical protein
MWFFDKANCEGYASHMLEKNFRIDRLKVDVLILQIKVVKWISKSSNNYMIGFIIKELEYVVVYIIFLMEIMSM